VEELTVLHPVRGPRRPALRRIARLRARRVKRGYLVLLRALRRTFVSMIAHNSLNLAQSTAYASIVALFPTLLVAAAVIGLLPDTAPVRFQLSAFFDRVLPPGVSPLLDAAFENTPQHAHSVRALVTAAIVSLAGASNVIVTLMEGLRRASGLPPDCWSFWQRRRRSFELVPLSLVPLTVASLLVVFGHAVTVWLTHSIGPNAQPWTYAITLLIRWGVALAASIGLIALIYRLGVPETCPEGLRGRADRRLRNQRHPSGRTKAAVAAKGTGSRRSVFPGAVMATAMWFLTTLAFGWYVTRFANYSEVYGSLGAGIALLFWLYIISLSVLCGAEFNAQFDSQMQAHPVRPWPTPLRPPEANRAVPSAKP
jgi:membrane protein